MAIKSKKVRIGRRERIKNRIRKKIRGTDALPRLSVFRSGKHIYAQVISDQTGKTLASASTLDKDLSGAMKSLELAEGASKSSKSTGAARAVGKLIADRAKSQNLEQVVFDRNGFLFHGRVKALADGAREGGLKF